MLTLQALAIAALPDSQGILAHAERWVLTAIAKDSAVSLPLLSAGLVVLAFLVQLAVQYVYHRVLGTLIGSAAEHLPTAGTSDNLVERRRVSAILASNTVKILEISIFLLLLGVFIFMFSPILLSTLVLGGLLALGAFVWIRKGDLQNKARLDRAKRALGATLPSQKEYSLADERNRFSKNFAVSLEGCIIGLFTASIVVVFVVADIAVSPEMAIYAVGLVFSVRYAVVYVRELGRAMSGLLSLRTEKLIK